ncbi:response regulator [Pontibacter sp. E15-1]|uniref:response regulator n=1 Tax=Pontibacter sp. E15-1 TaxID=2919918 RepID=UPI001F4FFB25|nr:response regulator [Pontibacter sp. E15-1]MCJ8164261.1 response regulator [Pontibacter sp. E15-1]
MYKKVFIVDDDEVSTFLTETALDAEGFAQAYESFVSGKQALAVLLPLLETRDDNALPDLILLDLNMPALTGWDFLQALHPYAGVLQQQCRIYILSSSVDESEMERASQNNLVAGFLQKPLLEDTVRKLLHGY